MEMVRISGGTVKGRKVGSRKAFVGKNGDEELRPTSAKVREALFDILRTRLPGSTFLDLYAGTGAIGIEALSRGADRAIFVESNDLRARLIGNLASEFGFGTRAEVIRANAFDFLKKAIAAGREFDIVFVDPPYSSEEIMKVLPVIGEEKIVKAGGAVVVEHFRKRVLPDVIGKLTIGKRYHYGDTTLSLYRMEKE